MDYVKFVYRPLAARAARQALVGRNRAQRSPDRGRFTRADVEALLKTAWGDYAARVVKLPPEPTVGSRMNVKLACFTMSFSNALLGIGTERAYAIELVADAVWRVYRLWSAAALGLAHVTPGKTTSLAFAVTNHGDPHGRVSLSFPFNAPGYLIEAYRPHRTSCRPRARGRTREWQRQSRPQLWISTLTNSLGGSRPHSRTAGYGGAIQKCTGAGPA
jgi:hypothetical protein